MTLKLFVMICIDIMGLNSASPLISRMLIAPEKASDLSWYTSVNDVPITREAAGMVCDNNLSLSMYVLNTNSTC